MDLFTHYQEDFLETRDSIQAKIDRIATLSGVEKSNEVYNAGIDIGDAEQLVKTMELCARNVSNNSSILQKIKQYEAEIGNLKAELRKAELKVTSPTDRELLFAGAREDLMSGSQDQRERLLATTERLDKTGRTLKHTIATAEESVTIGIDVMQNLDKQKNQMIGMRENLSKIGEQVGKARRIMRVMGRRMVANKLIMALIIFILLVAIGLIVYLKWIN